MHWKTQAAAFLVLTAGFAGCATPAQQVDDVIPLFDPAGLAASHPAYGYLTNAALLEAPQPGAVYQDIDGVRVWYKPAMRELGVQPAAMDLLAQTPDVAAGHGIAVFGSLVIAGGQAGPMHIIDVSVPERPQVLGTSEDSPVRDADTILYPDGRLIVISTSGGNAITATEITEPTAPVVASTIETPRNNHNIAVVPGTPIVYNTGSGPAIDIVDFSDPAAPAVVGSFENGDHCHDIAFYINQTAGKAWALCAGYAQTEIWDITDPLAPSMLVEIDYPSPDKGLPVVGGQLDDMGVPHDPVATAARPVNDLGVLPVKVSGKLPGSISHLAMVNHDATVLIMGDETGGGAINGCDFYYEDESGNVHSGPLGNLWFYDITDPAAPDLRGHVSPGYQDADLPGRDGTEPGSCTAHFGRNIGQRDLLVMSYYTAGLVIVDYEDLDNPRIVDRLDLGGDIWDVWFHQGYLFTGDMRRGVDVVSLE